MDVIYSLRDKRYERINPPLEDETEDFEEFILETIKWKVNVSRKYFTDAKNFNVKRVNQAIINLQQRGAPIIIKVRE